MATFRDFWKIERDPCVGLCSDTEQETALEQEIRHNKWEQRGMKGGKRRTITRLCLLLPALYTSRGVEGSMV